MSVLRKGPARNYALSCMARMQTRLLESCACYMVAFMYLDAKIMYFVLIPRNISEISEANSLGCHAAWTQGSRSSCFLFQTGERNVVFTSTGQLFQLF